MRVFCRSWAQYIEIHRFPAIGHRMKELERIVAFARPGSGSATKENADSAISEISRIVRDASARLDG